MRRIGLLVPAAALLAAVLVAVAVGVAGGGVWAALLSGAALGLIAGLQVLTITHLRRVRRRLDRLDKRLSSPAQVATARPAAPADETRWMGRLPLPPMSLRFMKEDDERFVRTGRELAELVLANGAPPDGRLLDVGSGYGRLAVGLLDIPDFTGSYLGFDILAKHVGWCQDTITPLDGRFRFEHHDVRNERYNPRGTLDPAEETFPVADGSVDSCALFSVFTHLYRPAIERYLHEIRRVLAADGVAVTTWLLFDEERLEAVQSDKASYPLRLVAADGARYWLSEDPLAAIGYDQDDVVSMAAKADLDVLRVSRGSWAGEPGLSGDTFQDLVILAPRG